MTKGRPGTGRWLAAVGYALLALICVVVAAVTFLLVAPPLEAVRDRLVRQVEARTGRTLSVAGPLSVTLLPSPVVSIADVSLLPPQGMEAAPTVEVPSIDAEMSLWSLLSRRPQLDRLTLHRPMVLLAIDAQGRRSWDVRALDPAPRRSAERATSGRSGEPAPSEQPHPPAARRQRASRPVALRIVDGTIRFHDARTGTQHEIAAVNLDLTRDDATATAHAAGTLAWQGQAFEVSASVAPARDAAGSDPAARRVRLALAGAPVDMIYEGTLAADGAATGTVSIKHLAYKDVRVGPGRVDVDAKGGETRLTLRDLELYGGRGNGVIVLDSAGESPAIKADLQVAGVAALPLLKDAAGVGWLDGTGTLGLALQARGGSEAEILQSLQGRVQLAVADGGVTGFDVDRALRAIQRGRLDRMAPKRGDRTPFQSLTASFDIADGVARNGDLKLASAHVQLDGAGTIELAPSRIDYTLRTRIEGGKADEGSAVSIGTVEVPIAITGSLDRPVFSIKGQEELSDTLKQIGRNLRSREMQDAIEGLLSGDRSKRVKPADLLDQLLKKD